MVLGGLGLVAVPPKTENQSVWAGLPVTLIEQEPRGSKYPIFKDSGPKSH